MKTLLPKHRTVLFVLALSIGLSGCKSDETPVTPPPTPPSPVESTITLEVTEITMNDALLTSIPTPADMQYIAAVDFASEFDKTTIVATNKAAFEAAAQEAGQTLEEYLAAYAFVGTKSSRLGPLTPKLEYVAYAYGIDAEGNATTEVFTESFSTEAVPSGEKIDCTIDIIAVNITDATFDVTFTPTDETVYYYCTVTDQEGYDAMSADWNGYIYNYITSRLLENLTLEDVIKVICNRGRYSSRASRMQPATTYYACAVGVNMEALVITDVAVKQVTTLAEYEKDYGFSATVEQIVWNGAKISITPNDPTAFYYWNTMTAAEYDALHGDEELIETYFEEKLDAMRIEQFGEYADFYPLADYIIDRCSDKADTYAFSNLTSSTTYYVYALWVDSSTGKKSSGTWFSEPFSTPVRPVSSAGVEASLWLTDGDDWAALNPTGYGHFAGKAITGARLTPSGNAAQWYSNIYPAGELDKFTEEAFITALLKSYYHDVPSYYISNPVEWGGEYVILSVAVDADGAPGNLTKVRFTADRSIAEELTEIPEN